MRTTIIKACALNITVHPHKPEYYTQIIEKAFKERNRCDGGSDTVFIIGSVTKTDEGCCGCLYRFTDIHHLNWFNDKTKMPATGDELSEVIVPEHMKANLKEYAFVLFEASHILVVQHYHNGVSLSSSKAHKVFERLLNQDTIMRDFGKVDVQVISHPSTIEAILKAQDIYRLDLRVSLPNPDDDPDVQDIFDEIGGQNAQSLNQSLTAKENEHLQLSARNKALIKASSQHGSSVAYIESDKNNPLSTERAPYIENTSYNSENQNFIHTLMELAGKMVEKIKTKR